jgi:pyridoxal phosphate enzyme (YggS family)
MSALVDRLGEVRGRIERAAQAAGRAPETVRLVAVSKMHPAAAIREAYAEGQRIFGESYAQELARKALELADLVDLEWHFIGHLQSNKAKLVAAHARVIHALDGSGAAKELARRRQAIDPSTAPIDVLLEVNVTGESTKHGVPPQELDELLALVRTLPELRAAGLMTMPPADDAAAAKSTFETLASLRNLHGGAAALPELSMGMSDDLELAIAAGSTYVRVGTAIFGAR